MSIKEVEDPIQSLNWNIKVGFCFVLMFYMDAEYSER